MNDLDQCLVTREPLALDSDPTSTIVAVSAGATLRMILTTFSHREAASRRHKVAKARATFVHSITTGDSRFDAADVVRRVLAGIGDAFEPRTSATVIIFFALSTFVTTVWKSHRVIRKRAIGIQTTVLHFIAIITIETFAAMVGKGTTFASDWNAASVTTHDVTHIRWV